MQVEDGVGDDAGRFFLVSPGCHHEYWDAPPPGSPEHNLISFYDALVEKNERKAAVSVSTAADSISNFSEFGQAAGKW